MEQALNFRGMAVTEPVEVEVVRLLRNQCRAYMTRDTHDIGPAEQQLWWSRLDHEANRLFLFFVTDTTEYATGTTAVGYGFCRKLGGTWWVSGGLASAWQGKGLGKKLFGFLLEQTGLPCWLEVLEHNARAFNTYRALGFVEVSRDGGIVTMVKR